MPRSRRLYFKGNWLAENSWLARFVISAYVELRHPRVRVPDPTERLLEMVQNFVQDNGATFVVGLTVHDSKLEAFLQCRNIPFSVFEGAGVIADAGVIKDTVHWSREGHAPVADRTLKLCRTPACWPCRNAGLGKTRLCDNSGFGGGLPSQSAIRTYEGASQRIYSPKREIVLST
jgi:hypothetical protein